MRTRSGTSRYPHRRPFPGATRLTDPEFRGLCGFYKIGGAVGGFNATANSEVLPGFDQCDTTSDVTWLSLDRTQFTVQPGQNVTVTLSLDSGAATVSQPGTYTGQVGVRTDSPYQVAPVDVAMNVTPPKTWGKVTGAVTGGGLFRHAVALVGVTVQIDARNTSFTLRTDKDGRYALWLDAKNSPLTLIVAKDGWAPQTRQVTVKSGKVTTADFALKTLKTCS